MKNLLRKLLQLLPFYRKAFINEVLFRLQDREFTKAEKIQTAIELVESGWIKTPEEYLHFLEKLRE